MIINVPNKMIYVFDLDGTLYDQPRLRKEMAKRLIGYYALHPFKIYDLVIVYMFRKVKEDFDEKSLDYEIDRSFTTLDCLDVLICKKVSQKLKVSLNRVCAVIEKWIYENPLSAVRSTKDTALIEEINKLRNHGKKVVIFSDYPVEDKLKALDVIVDGAYSATDERIGELKPSKKGLEIIMQDYSAKPEDIVMIGDRMEKDGQSAIDANVDYVILPRSIKDRMINF